MNQKTRKILFYGLASLVLLLALILIVLNLTNKTYSISFYDNDTIIESVSVEKGQVITDKQIKAVEEMIELNDYDYKIYWSLSKDDLIVADFSEIVSDTNVYLYRIKNEYLIDTSMIEHLNYQITQDGPIVKGSVIVLEIFDTFDNQYLQIDVNGSEVIPTDGKYYITIDGPTTITSSVKSPLTIQEVLFTDKVYSGTPKEVDYKLYDIDGKEVDLDVTVTYRNSNQDVVSEIINAGKYFVTFSLDDEQYYLKEKTIEVEVEKKAPSLTVSDKQFTYDEAVHALLPSDVITDSDGEIVFINNDNINVGKYFVTVKVLETINYLEAIVNVEVEIVPGTLSNIDMPDIGHGFVGELLGDVVVEGEGGTFEWVNPNTPLIVGQNQYQLKFTSYDPGYLPLIIDVIVDTLTIDEMKEQVISERSYVLDDIDVGSEVTELPKLPVDGTLLDTSIIWFSNNNVIKIDESGFCHVIGNPGVYNVILTGMVVFGNTVDYITLMFDFIIPTIEEIEVEKFDSEKPVEIAEVSQVEEPVEHEKIVIYNEMKVDMISKPRVEKAQIVAVIIKGRFIISSESAVSNEISEIILWLILTNGAGGSHSLLKNKSIIYKTSLEKGEVKYV